MRGSEKEKYRREEVIKMMSLEVIDRLADETGEYAKELGKEPYFIQFAWEKVGKFRKGIA